MRSRLLPVVALALTLGLAGCVDPATAPALPTESPVTDPPLPAPTVEPTSGADPIGVGCADLVDPDAVYAVNPNLALIGPADDTTEGERAVAAGGVSCRWVLESGGSGMDVVAAHLPAAELDALRSAASSGEAVSGNGYIAYFDAGTTTVVTADTWLVVRSDLFSSGQDVIPIVESALAAVAG